MHPRQQVSSLMIHPYCRWFTGQHKEQSHTSLAITVVSYVMGKMKYADVYLILTGTKRNHSHRTEEGSKHTPSIVTVNASSASKVVLAVTYNNIQPVDVIVETLLAPKRICIHLYSVISFIIIVFYDVTLLYLICSIVLRVRIKYDDDNNYHKSFIKSSLS